MSKQDCNTVRSLTLHEILVSEHNKQLVRQYALSHCSGNVRNKLLKIVA